MTKPVVSTCPARHVSMVVRRTCHVISHYQRIHRHSKYSAHDSTVSKRLGRACVFHGRNALNVPSFDLARDALESPPQSAIAAASLSAVKTMIAVIAAMAISLDSVYAEEMQPQIRTSSTAPNEQQQSGTDTAPLDGSAMPNPSTSDDGDDKRAPLLVEKIKWLNQVTSQVTEEELNEAHPPPLRDMVDSVMSSEVSKDIQGISHVVGGVVVDLKDGFVGLNDTIRHINNEDNPLMKKASSNGVATETVQEDHQSSSPSDTKVNTTATNSSPASQSSAS
ncbi:hypothetical protein PSENEW3_00001237 [Picochlorum sp. SENEW3]|nr:hypothetical protein PSENEW3_00001237 [Picochlorum sp. SENEW3]